MDKGGEKNTVICPLSWCWVTSNQQKLWGGPLLVKGGSSCEGLTWTSSKERAALYLLHLLSRKTRWEVCQTVRGFPVHPEYWGHFGPPPPRTSSQFTWLNIQTETKSTHILHGMHFPNAKKTKTNQHEKLRLSCKASVNTTALTRVCFPSRFFCSAF